MARSAANIKSLETVSFGFDPATCTEIGQPPQKELQKGEIRSKSSIFS
jgi:hypothetical protein